MKIRSYMLEDGNTVVATDDKRSQFEYNLLKHLNSDEIGEYAERVLGMVDEDECEADVKLVSDEDLVAELAYRGYSVVDEDLESNLDHLDSTLLDEIIAVFNTANWAERIELHKQITGL